MNKATVASLLLLPFFFFFLLEMKMGDGNKLVVVTFFKYFVAKKAMAC
jgi:hypothetical protein